MMNFTKGITAWLVVLAILISLCPMSIVMAADYTVRGDSTLLVPNPGAIKINYTLVDATDTEVSGATWSVTNKDGSPCSTYAKMDSNGILYVSSEAIGKTLKIGAAYSGGTYYKDVAVKSGYFIDFEDVAAVKKVFGDSAESLIKTDASGNHYGDGRGNNIWANGGTLKIQISDGMLDDTQYINVKCDFGYLYEAGVENKATDAKGIIPIWYGWKENLKSLKSNREYGKMAFSGPGIPNGENIKFGINRHYSQSAGQANWSDGYASMTVPISSDNWYSMESKLEKTVITDGFKAVHHVAVKSGTTVSKNNINVCTNNESNNAYYMKKNSMVTIAFGARVDNIEVYTGEKLTENVLPVNLTSSLHFADSKEGETAVYKLPGETTVKFTDSVNTAMSFDVEAPVVYSSAEVGVSIDEGILYVDDTVTGFDLSYTNAPLKLNSTKNISCFENNYTALSAGEDIYGLSMSGWLLARFKTENALRLKLNGDISISADAPNSAAEGVIAIDTVNNEYYAVFDNKFVGSDAFADASLTSVENEGDAISEFTLTSMVKTKPLVIDPKITGASAVGLPLTADFSYYSPYGALEGTHSYEWLVSDSENGSYSQVATTKEWTPDESYAEYWVKAKITLKDTNGFEATTFETTAQYIKDVFSINLTSGNLNLEVQNVLANISGPKDSTFYVLISKYKNGTHVNTTAEKLSFPNTNDALVKDYTIDADIDGVKLSLIDEDGFTPIGVSKQATIGYGTVPDYSVSSDAAATGVSVAGNTIMVKEGSSGVASLMVLDTKGTDTDKSSYWHDMYELDDIYTAADSGVCSDGIIWAENIALSSGETTAYTLPALPKGSYRVVLTKADGTKEEAYLLSKKSELLKADVMKLPGFKKALELYIASDAALAADTSVKALTDKGRTMTEKLIKADNYDFNKLMLNAKLIGYLENSAPGGAAYTEIKTVLEANSLAVKGIELMQNDANKTATANAVLSGSWTSAKTLTDSIRDIAIRYGVAHVINNDEADFFLKELTDTNYPTSPYKAAIRSLVGGKLYASMTDLKNAINGYTPIGGGGGGGAGGGSGSGGSMGGGSVGGVNPGADTVVVPSIPSVDTDKNSFSDVSSSHWAAEHIGYLVENKILNGFPDGSFKPEQAILRAEFVKLICAAFKLESDKKVSFADVAENAWYAPYTSICASLGIVKGDGISFMPEREISREEAATMIYRTLYYIGYELPEGKGSLLDQAEISDFADESVKSLISLGLISGMEDGKFHPFDSMTRAQCAKIIALAMRG